MSPVCGIFTESVPRPIQSISCHVSLCVVYLGYPLGFQCLGNALRCKVINIKLDWPRFTWLGKIMYFFYTFMTNVLLWAWFGGPSPGSKKPSWWWKLFGHGGLSFSWPNIVLGQETVKNGFFWQSQICIGQLQKTNSPIYVWCNGWMSVCFKMLRQKALLWYWPNKTLDLVSGILFLVFVQIWNVIGIFMYRQFFPIA